MCSGEMPEAFRYISTLHHGSCTAQFQLRLQNIARLWHRRRSLLHVLLGELASGG